MHLMSFRKSYGNIENQTFLCWTVSHFDIATTTFRLDILSPIKVIDIFKILPFWVVFLWRNVMRRIFRWQSHIPKNICSWLWIYFTLIKRYQLSLLYFVVKLFVWGYRLFLHFMIIYAIINCQICMVNGLIFC